MALDFLLGHWQAVNQPGEPTGGFDFASQLQSKVIVRTNYADYPATAERAAFRHEDLMIIYYDENQNLLADYYDSEGHVIHYTGQVRDGNRVVFQSAPTYSGPAFRLSYQLETDGRLSGTFEIAQLAELDKFMPYLAWSAIKIPAK